jgi:acyl-CoA synthetase (AMP-forming)/AMP-acid ligase II/3-hydroxymyristoyl/3-hydroxydecanoyl-(acyl carrier protein) dehydratase
VNPARLPLLAPRDLAAPLAWCQGQPVSAAQFIAEAEWLAARLPAQGQPINLCQDRYRFALGLAAALLRGHTSLMPPNALPDTLRALQGGGDAMAPVYALVDEATASPQPADDAPAHPVLAVPGLPSVVVQRAAGLAPASDVPTVAADFEAVRLLTSGSTGAPQPHGKRWGQLVANIGAEAERLAQHLGRPDLAGLTIVATVPAQHSYGFESTVLLALLGGAAFDAGRPFYPADVAAALARVPAPRALVTTPFHLKTLLLAGVALPATALTLSATAPLSPQLAAQAETALQGPLVEIYGCTEAGQVASRRTTAGERWQTLGALRIAARTGAAGGEEAFVVSGGHVLEPTPLADVLVLDDAQHFRLLGRANDLIHVAGKRSSLAHLNFHLNRIEGVDDGAFWLPDEAGEGVVRPVAFVVAPRLTAAQVIVGLRAHLEAVFVPRRVVFVDALPREATGKLTAQALRRLATQHLGAGAGAVATASPAAAPALAAAAVDLHADGSVSARWPIAAEHPAFDGHFPGRPLLPGVVLLSLVMETLGRAPQLQQRLGAAPRIDSVKFLAPVAPRTEVELALRLQGSGVAFELRVAGQTVARGQLAPGAAT